MRQQQQQQQIGRLKATYQARQHPATGHCRAYYPNCLIHVRSERSCTWLCRTTTVGQVVGAYTVLAFMLTLGSPLLATLFVYRHVMRDQLKGTLVHKYTNTIVGVTWWLHNKVLRYLLGSGC